MVECLEILCREIQLVESLMQILVLFLERWVVKIIFIIESGLVRIIIRGVLRLLAVGRGTPFVIITKDSILPPDFLGLYAVCFLY